MPADAAGAPGQEREQAAGRPVGLLLVVSGDPPVRRRLGLLAAESGLAFADAGAAGTPAAGPPAAGGDAGVEPAVAVLDLGWPGALDLIRAWRSRWPAALLAGYLAVPDRERWVAAQRAGCDLVANRGALVLRLREALAHSAAPAARAFPLFDAADAAGRLGLVFRAADTPAGPVAVYRVDGQLRAIADRCPHAGAALSDGEAEGGVLTCPGHGSRFDICTGERLRGPADAGIAVFPLAERGGQICLLART
ncbi:MAG: Rieske 2Fe-2S domain-containing protein [Gemmatimonadota bacterium]